MMDFKGETKEQLLLRRVFKLIYESHFSDHKLSPFYIERVSFDRQLGEDIANYIQAKFPEYYHQKRKEIENFKRQRRIESEVQ